MMMKQIILLSFFLLIFPTINVKAQKSSTIIGAVEEVTLPIENITVRARIDTGARASSLHAEKIEIIEENGQKFVHFTTTLADATSGKETTYNMVEPLLKTVDIKRRSVEGLDLYETRPVIELEICLDGQTYLAPINLNNRKNFEFPMLIGRHEMNILNFIVDPKSENIAQNSCN